MDLPQGYLKVTLNNVHVLIIELDLQTEQRKGFTNIAEECVDINECLLTPCGEHYDYLSDGSLLSTITCMNTGFG